MTNDTLGGMGTRLAEKRRLRFVVIVPVLNAEHETQAFLAALRQQTIAPDIFLVIDSSSIDRSAEIFADAGARVHIIPRSEFNHADTRQMAVDMALEMLNDIDIAVFLTQDAVLAAPDSLELLLAAFEDLQIGIAYGRQLPRAGADTLESYVRLFNYPGRSEVRSFEDRHKYGFRTCFFSNSYAAYRVQSLNEAGGFPSGLILGEDVGASANMLLDGWKLAYVADACVFHSHGYTAGAYFRRSFDIGVQHTQMQDKIKQFGRPEGMGVRYVLAETGYLLCHAPLRIPEAVGRNILRYIGYRLGRIYLSLPISLVRKLSMHRGFWAYQVRKTAGT
jgi:rhamnosyltransferase